MLSAFGDESHDKDQQTVFAVAALVGTEDQWDELIEKWIKRTGGIEFHATDCESDANKSNTRHQKDLSLYRDLAQIIVGSGLFGWGTAIELTGFKEVFPDAIEDYPYFWCFMRVVKQCAEFGYLSVPQEKVKFTFEHRLDSEYHASALYNYMAHRTVAKLHASLYDEVAFACKKTVQLQAADLLARETMKRIENQFNGKRRHPRRSLVAIADTQRF